MIKHIYLFRLKKDADPDIVIQKLQSLKEHIPEISDLEVGRDFRHAENSFDICENLTFKDMDSFQTFVDDPYHNSIREYMSQVQEIGVKIDYTIES